MIKRSISAATCALLLGLGLTATANAADELGGKKEFTITDFTRVDTTYVEKQRETINSISRSKLGVPIRGNKTDLETLQRIVDGKFIDPKDTLTLQSTGVAMADLLLKEYPQLQWKIYEDEVGRSRALCLKDEKQCLFPMTMISRRYEVGAPVNVNVIYASAILQLKPFLQKNPYDLK